MEHVTSLLNDHAGLVAGATAAAVGAAYLWSTSNAHKPFEYDVSLDAQSVECEPGVRVSTRIPSGDLVTHFYPDATTSHEAFTRGLRVSNNGPFLGTRTGKHYEWLSYQQVYDAAQQMGSAMVELGLKPEEESLVGIYASNSAEWIVTKEAASMFSMAYVPLYDTLGPEACIYIINQTSMRFIACDKMKKAEAILEMASELPSLEYLIVYEATKGTSLEGAEKNGVKVISYADFLELGKKHLRDPVPPTPSTLYTLCYTSGTTGNPKGVMLTHGNLISNTSAVLKILPASMHMLPSDRHISYLPLAHSFEMLVELMMIQHGAQIGFFRGDVKLLLEDLQELKPTIFPTVPRLLNRIYDKVLLGVEGSILKTFLFNLALSKKQALLDQGVFTQDTIWDRLVFSKVQKLMGGCVRLSITGSAPLAANVLNFARCAFGCIVFEGYGQTEATAGITLTLPNEKIGGHVGAPLPCNKVKLVDVSEMDYFSRNNKGEVCVKGTNMMRGYYKEPEKTNEAVDAEGWLHTGDIGEWLPNGALRIIDRKKHIFKLAQGEYLAPEKIEGVYVRSSMIAQAFIDGDSLQVFAVGIIVPDPDVLPSVVKGKLGITGSMEQLCLNPQVKKLILDDMTALGKKAGLKSFEQAKDIVLYPEQFSIENGLLTPTFKSKRPVLRKFFAPQMKEMYDNAAS